MLYVMTMIAYKFRFYPTSAQEQALCKMFGAARWAWNTCLAWRSAAYTLDGESVSGMSFSKELTWLKTLEPFSWLKEIPTVVYNQALRDQDKAFSAFFAKRARYPKFRRKGGPESIRFQLNQRTVMSNFRDGELLKLHGLGKIDVCWSRKMGGVPKMVTVRRDASGRYFVSMTVETVVDPLPQKTNAVGIDVGLKDIVVTSDGMKTGNPRHLRKAEKKLKRAQRQASRKVKGSNRRKKAVLKVAKLHAKVADTRADFLHKLSTGLIREYQIIAIEDLSIKGMARGRLSRSVADAGLGELRRLLTYKAEWYGRNLVVIDRWEPTSKVCSECGHKMDSMPLTVREWTCPECGSDHDRDVNAARNVLTAAMVGRTKGSAQSAKARGVEGSGAVPPVTARNQPR